MIDDFKKKKRLDNFKIFVYVISGSIMIGHGLRMIYQGVFFKGSSYFPNTFDIFFDWLTLAVLGSIIFYFGIKKFYKKTEEKKYYLINSKNDEPFNFPT
jgi:hypothetical protein